MKYNTDKILKAIDYRFDIINEKINLLGELIRLITEKTNSNDFDKIIELFKEASRKASLIEEKYLKQN